jgi:type I restriction enzyme, S subunit
MTSECWDKISVAQLIARGALAINDGYRVRNSELGPAGIPFVRGGDIGDGSITTSVHDHILPEFSSRVQAKLTQPYDVAFITKGTVGRVGMLQPNQPQCVFAPQVCYWRSLNPDLLDPRFLLYLLRSGEFQSNLDAVKTHGSMVADYVSMTDQRHFKLTVPPPSAQKRIARILGTLDDKIELNRRMNDTLEAMARALFKSWFVDFDPVRMKMAGRDPGLPKDIAGLFPDRLVESELGEIPQGWKIQQLGRLCSIEKGLSYKGSGLVLEGGLPMVNLGCFDGSGSFKVEGLKRYQGDHKDRHLVRSGDLVIANTDMTQKRVVLGSPAIVPRLGQQHEFIFTHHTFALRFSLDTRSWLHHIYFTLLQPEFREIAEGFATGTTVLALPKDGLTKFPLILPSDSLRDEFSRQFDTLLQRIEMSRNESSALMDLRDELLPRLLSGELCVPQLK